jgi:hypothetical protein
VTGDRDLPAFPGLRILKLTNYLPTRAYRPS